MDILITEFALDAYHDLSDYFDKDDYWDVIRPAAEKLKNYPLDPVFENPKFWGPAKDKSGELIKNLYKLKFHNFGPGKVQLRQLVALFGDKAYLLKAYIKSTEKYDFRQMAKAKVHVDLIKQAKIKIMGKI